MRTLVFFLTVILLIILTATVQARIINVPADSSTIQGGINGASAGDTVMVHPGTYYEHDIDFLGKAITVMGTDPEDSTTVAATIVDANSIGRVFVFNSSEDSTSVLAGLTITGGHSEYSGGGIYCLTSSPTIANSIITGNFVHDQGGGIFCWESSPEILNNIITANTAYREGSEFSWGGGVYCKKSFLVVISGNIIKDNYAGIHGGGIYCTGYGSEYCSPTITDNIIADNWSLSCGGGIFLSRIDSLAIISNNIITDNSSGDGGGIYGSYSSPTISNNTITGNSSTGGFADGGGIYLNDSSSMITDNIISGNTAGGDGGGICIKYNSCPSITNNIITVNTGRWGGGINCYSIYTAIINNNIISANWVREYGSGGGINCKAVSSAIISNNIIAENFTGFAGYGGGIYCEYNLDFPLMINNNTITDNHTGLDEWSRGGGIYCEESRLTITNTILWSNEAPEGGEIWIGTSEDPSKLAIGYSNVEGGQDSVYVSEGSVLQWGEGMINADPLFFDPYSKDYHLSSESPCIDAGDPDSPNVPWGGWRRDMGAYEYDQGFYYNGHVLIRKPVKSATNFIAGPKSTKSLSGFGW